MAVLSIWLRDENGKPSSLGELAFGEIAPFPTTGDRVVVRSSLRQVDPAESYLAWKALKRDYDQYIASGKTKEQWKLQGRREPYEKFPDNVFQLLIHHRGRPADESEVYAVLNPHDLEDPQGVSGGGHPAPADIVTMDLSELGAVEGQILRDRVASVPMEKFRTLIKHSMAPIP